MLPQHKWNPVTWRADGERVLERVNDLVKPPHYPTLTELRRTSVDVPVFEREFVLDIARFVCGLSEEEAIRVYGYLRDRKAFGRVMKHDGTRTPFLYLRFDKLEGNLDDRFRKGR